MPVTAGQPAPYAPASAILDLIGRHRSKGLPSPVDAAVLGRAGISDSLIPRTLQALQTLDLIGEDGKPSAVLEGIRLAPEAEYQQRLRDWLTNAYADALQYVDPETADETNIRDAFRSYNPVGQQPRMVSLFLGLFRAAGIAPAKPETSTRKPATPTTKPKGRPLPKQKPKPNADTRVQRTGAPIDTTGLPLPLAGLLTQLPEQGRGWTSGERDNFLEAFTAVLNFCFPIITSKAEDSNSAEYDEDDE